ncbi:MAG: PAS domain S-box protein [Thermodesulfobacteriota bacterium]
MKTKDEEKTREQLIDESAELRKKVAELQVFKSEQNRVLAALGESEENFRVVVENASDAILVEAGEGSHVYANQQAAEITGYCVAELLKTTIKDLAHPDEFEKIMQIYRRRLGGEPVPRLYETTIIRKDGKSVLIEVAGTKTVWQGKTADMVFFRDITERKRAEIALRQERDRAQQYLDMAGTMLLALDAEEKVTLVNKRGCEILGYRDEEILGKPWIDNFLPEMIREEVRGVFHRLMAGEVEPLKYYKPVPVLCKGGVEKFIAFHNAVLRDERGEIIGTLSSGEDVTERKRAEAQIEYQAHLLANVQDAIIATDEQLVVTAWNHAAEEMYGWKAEEVLGRNVFAFLGSESTEAQRAAAIRTMAETGRNRVEEVVHHRRDGEPIHMEATVTALGGADGRVTGYVNVLRDITERKKAEEKIKDLAKFPSENPFPILRLDKDGAILYANESSQVLLQDWGCGVGSYAPTLWRDLVAEAMSSQSRRTVDVKFGEQTYLFNVVPILDAGYVNLYVTNITARKQAEEALKKSEERFRTSAETLLEGFAILSAVRDSNGQIIDFKYEYINKAGCKMNQKPHEEHMGKTLLELLPTHKEIGLFDEYVRVVETGQSLTKEFLIYETVYGSGERLRQAFDVRITRLGDGFVTTWQDITDKKKWEELLRRSEERLRLLIENSKDVVIMADLEGSLIYYNGPPEYGITAEEALGKNPFSIFEPAIAASLMNQLKLVIKGGEALTFENNIPWRGESFGFLNQMYPIRDEKGRMIAVGLIARDITERKRAEEALRESEERFRRLSEASFEGILFHEEGKIIDANEAYATMFGYGLSEVIGKNALDFAMPELREVALGHMRDGSEELYEGVATRKDGSRFFVEVRGKNTPYKGRTIRLTAVRDITERKKAEEVLRESEAKYRTLVERLQEGVYQSDIEGNYITLNQAGVEIFGFDFPEQIVCKLETANLYVDVSERAEIIEEIRRTGSSLREVQARKRDGTIIWLLVNNNARRDAEEALRESEEKYHTLFEESRDAISITTREGKFIDINQAWLELLGYTKEELMSLNVQETYANPDDRPRVQKEIERKGFVRDYEIKLRKKDGTEIDSLLTFTVWRAYNGNILGYQGIIRDITEYKRAEDQILRQGAVLDGISKVFRQALICKTEEELSSKSLTVAEELTGSKFGWIGEINQEGRLDAIALSDPGWNECRMSKSDAVVMLKDMEIRGIWGKVLKEEQSLIVNGPLSHPDSVGTPEGHPPITAFLGVPLKQAGKTFGMIALANT